MRKTWESRASMKLADKGDSLRKVLDPNDVKGIKNNYIDQYLKFYLMKSLKLHDKDSIVEIGSGIGRLTEFVAHYVKSAYGVDIIEKFVNDCNANPSKCENTAYYSVAELDKLPRNTITKIFFVWVLMYIREKNELIQVLSDYRKLFSNAEKIVVIEQVKVSEETEFLNGVYYCSYRTIAEYVEIFESAGFSLTGHFVMGERVNGILARLFFNRYLYPLIPSRFVMLGKVFFEIDNYLMRIGVVRRTVKNRPVDVVFELVIKNDKNTNPVSA